MRLMSVRRWKLAVAVAICAGPATILAGMACAPRASAQENGGKSILLKARQFEPAAVSARTALVPASTQRLIIQFEHGVLLSDVEALEERGVTILSGVPQNAVFATVPAGTPLDEIKGIRWAGALAPSDKISPKIGLSLNSRRFALVDLHPDADVAEARDAIETAGGTIHERDGLPATTLLVRINSRVVDLVSQIDDVAYIYPASMEVIAGEPFHFCPGPMGELGTYANFVVNDNGWDGAGLGTAALTYNFGTGTADIAGDGEQTDVIAGLVEWGDVVGLTFSPTGTANSNLSHQIFWGTGEHGDGFPFDGASGVLAHAFFPANAETIRGDMHFDDAENWAPGGSPTYTLFSVALHEAGHAHGLGHSDDPEAVMYPSTRRDNMHLEPDDIMGVQSIYARPPGVFELYTPLDGGKIAASLTTHVVWVDGMGLGGNVSIDLYKNGVLQGNIVASTPNDGFFDWAVPDWMRTGSDYTLRVTPEAAPGSFTEHTFTIVGVERNTFSMAAPEPIPDNGDGTFNINVPGGLGEVVDIEFENVGIDYPDFSDLAIVFFPAGFAGSNSFLVLPGSCPATAVSSANPFNLTDSSSILIGDDCPPVSGESYVCDTAFRKTTHLVADPTGFWQIRVFDFDGTAGAGGTVQTFDLVLKTAVDDPGPFSPVFVDGAAVSPGAGTNEAPFTIMEPALDLVLDGGEIQIEAGTYAVPASINQAVTLTALNGVVTLE